MDDRIHELEQRVAELERRLGSLASPAAVPPPGEGQGTTLVAPVRIVDADGRLLARLESHPNDLSLSLFNRQGEAVAALGVDGTQAGYLVVRNAAADASRCGPSRRGAGSPYMKRARGRFGHNSRPIPPGLARLPDARRP